MIRVGLALLLALGGSARADPGWTPVLRPPRLPASPRHFGRDVRPEQPRTSVALQLAKVWGGVQQGVEPEQLATGVLVELGLGRWGAFVDATVVFQSARTEGVYGPGEASTRGAGDLRFGGDAHVLSWTPWGRPCHLGLGLQVSAPTAGERWLQPETPILPAPRFQLGPARWTVSAGPVIAADPGAGFALQLNADLIGRVLRDREDAVHENDELFGAFALMLAQRPVSWLAAMIVLDVQLELLGRQHALRQLLFVEPALRVRPTPRIAIDLGVRLPLRQETRDEQRFSLGFTVAIGLGPEGDRAW